MSRIAHSTRGMWPVASRITGPRDRSLPGKPAIPDEDDEDG